MAVVAYYGGRVLSNVAVVAVFWTSNVDVTVQQQVGPFYAAITASSYVDWLSEYDTLGRPGVGGQPGSGQHIGRGRFVGAFTITPSNASITLDDGDVSAELASQIASGNLPAPSLDAQGNVNTLYMVELPPGYSVTLLGAKSCSQFCAYHWTTSIAGRSVPYVVLADMRGCLGACGQGFDDETILRSHEMAEAMTDVESGLVDPGDVVAGVDVYPMAWSGEGGAKGEIGDLCFNAFQGDSEVVAGYTVQKLWSNYAGACVTGVPICDGSADPPSCRPCTSYDDGAACSGATPECDVPTGRCRPCDGIECVADAGPDGGADAAARPHLEGGGDAEAAEGAGASGGGCATAGASACALDWVLLAGGSLLAMRGGRRRWPRRAHRPAHRGAASVSRRLR